jgi:uncharacterized protein YjbI with pentapeptide repeats
MNKKRTAIAWPSPRYQGKTFVLESTVSNADSVKWFIKEEGGRVGRVITASVDYLINGYRRGNKKSPEKKRADDLNQKGAAIQFLDEQQFFASLLPTTRDEALLWLKAGKKGRERWQSHWNHWNDAKFTLDFNGLDFRGKDFSGCNFCAATFVGADLRDANLSSCCLRGLKDIRFEGACLASASFSEASDCSFRKSDLSEAHINPAVFNHCDFTEARLCKIGGSYSDMKDCVFRKADLREAELEESKLQGLDFTGADLSGARLSRCDFTGAKLVGAKLVGADLTDAVLVGADLSKANLTEAILINVNLTSAIIDGANFTQATITALQLGDLDPTRARGLDPTQAARGGKVGPNIRNLETIVGQSGKLETQAIIDMAGESITLGLVSHDNGRWINTMVQDPACGYHGHTQSFSNGMIEVTRKFIRGTLLLDTITIKCSKGPRKAKDLKELVVKAWYEAMGIEPPSTGAIGEALESDKEARARRRDDLLESLRAGRKGVEQWNKLVIAIPQIGLGSDAANHLEHHLGAGPFRHVDLAGATLDGINLQHFDFDGANFEGASLKNGLLGEYTSFRKANFRAANLQEAECGIGRFSGANFAGAVMKKAGLRVCTFVNCNFQEADLTGADFGYADVRGADFSTAVLTNANWEQTKYDERTCWPKGFHPAEGLIWKGKGPDPRNA